jgi:hypothetical protein
MPSLRSGIPLGGEKEQKWRIAIVLCPKANGCAILTSYFKSCALKQAFSSALKWLRHFKCLVRIKIEASFILLLPLHLLTPFAFGHEKRGFLAPFLFLLRRVRDSNPRTCYSQQFSRLPHSTALPTLRGKCRKGMPILQKYLHLICPNN